MTGGNPPRIKGYNFERECKNIAIGAGHEAQRTPTSKYPDLRIDNQPVSCKRRKNGYAWIYKELADHDFILCRDDGKKIVKIQYWKP